MRILIANAHTSVVGGTESYLRSLIPGLLERGNQVALLGEWRGRPEGPSIAPNDGRTETWTVTDVGRTSVVLSARRFKPDVVYMNGLVAPALERSLLELAPAVLFGHSYYGTCATGTKRHAFPQIVSCQRTLGPGCLVLNFARQCGYASPVALMGAYRRQLARRTLLTRYRAICVASEHMRTEYVRHGVPEAQLHVLPPPPAGIQRDAAPPSGRRVSGQVALVGRLTALKGGTFLIEALVLAGAQLGTPLFLTVLGDGPERPGLEVRARALGLTARFTGWTGPAERNRILRTVDLLALPSLWPEPWGLVGLEAACVGVPTVAFAVGGIPEWLVGGESGELAPASPPTPAGLAAAIVRALRDPAHYARLCHGAWVRVAQYTEELHLDQLLAILAGAAR